MNRKAREIHAEVEHLRERGEFLEALKLSDEAFLGYQGEKDIFGQADILASRSITLRLLWEKLQDPSFLVLAKHEAMAGVEIAKKSSEKSNTIMPLFRLGQVQEELGEIIDACTSYNQAVELFQNYAPKEHNRPAVLYDMQIRAAVCEYKSGKKDSIIKAEEALKHLEDDVQEATYTKEVWASGGHMKIAEVLKDTNLEEAKRHLQKAKEIIDQNPDLTLRKGQWERLASLFS